MRVMALDIGEVRVGIAISDPARKVASPVAVLPAVEFKSCARTFRRVLDDWEPQLLVCGLPKSLSGDEGPQAKRIRAFAREVSSLCDLPCIFADERLSSQEAKRSLRAEGLSEKAMRGKVDMVAASLFLQAWLDSQATQDERQ